MPSPQDRVARGEGAAPVTGTPASPLSMYREMRAAGVLLPSMLWPWLEEERGNLGRIKKAKRNLTGLQGASPRLGTSCKRWKRETGHQRGWGRGQTRRRERLKRTARGQGRAEKAPAQGPGQQWGSRGLCAGVCGAEVPGWGRGKAHLCIHLKIKSETPQK